MAMQITGTQLNARTLAEVDRGNLALAIDHALRQAIEDVIQRPGDKGKRQVLLRLDFTPILERKQAVLDLVGMTAAVRLRIPDRVSDTYPMLPMRDKTLHFQPHSPHDPRQMVLYEENESATDEQDRPSEEQSASHDEGDAEC